MSSNPNTTDEVFPGSTVLVLRPCSFGAPREENSNVIEYSRQDSFTPKIPADIIITKVVIEGSHYPCTFDLSQLGDDVTSIRAHFNARFTGMPPKNLQVLIAYKIPESYWDNLPELKTLVTRTVSADRVLPPKLETYCGYELPEILPVSLVRVACSKFGTIPDHVKVLCLFDSIAATGEIPNGLECLVMSCNNPLFREDLNLRGSCPGLKKLSLPGQKGGYSFEDIFEGPVDDIFTLGNCDPVEIFHQYVDREIDVNNLPLELEELYLDCRVGTNIDLGHLPNLKVFKGRYGNTIFPRSLEGLVIEEPSGSNFWTDTECIEKFLVRIAHVRKLALVGMSRAIYDIFLEKQIDITLFLRYHPTHDTGLLACQVITQRAIRVGYIDDRFGEPTRFHASRVVYVVDSGEDKARITDTESGRMIGFIYHRTRYNYIGYDTVTNIQGNKIGLFCLTVPEECVLSRKKSARK